MPRATRFLNAFNAVEQHLRRSLGHPMGFSWGRLIDSGVREGVLTARHKEFLTSVGYLRNAISHGSYYDGAPIAEPVLQVVQDLERFRDRLLTPPKALDVLTSRTVVVFDYEDGLQKVLDA